MTPFGRAVAATFVLVVLRAAVTPAMPWWVAWGPLLLAAGWAVLVAAAVFFDLFWGRDLEIAAGNRRARQRYREHKARQRAEMGGRN